MVAADALPLFALDPLPLFDPAPVVANVAAAPLPAAELAPALSLPLDGVFVVACAALPVIGPGPCGPDAV